MVVVDDDDEVEWTFRDDDVMTDLSKDDTNKQ